MAHIVDACHLSEPFLSSLDKSFEKKDPMLDDLEIMFPGLNALLYSRSLSRHKAHKAQKKLEHRQYLDSFRPRRPDTDDDNEDD